MLEREEQLDNRSRPLTFHVSDHILAALAQASVYKKTRGRPRRRVPVLEAVRDGSCSKARLGSEPEAVVGSFLEGQSFYDFERPRYRGVYPAF